MLIWHSRYVLYNTTISHSNMVMFVSKPSILQYTMYLESSSIFFQSDENLTKIGLSSLYCLSLILKRTSPSDLSIFWTIPRYSGRGLVQNMFVVFCFIVTCSLNLLSFYDANTCIFFFFFSEIHFNNEMLSSFNNHRQVYHGLTTCDDKITIHSKFNLRERKVKFWNDILPDLKCELHNSALRDSSVSSTLISNVLLVVFLCIHRVFAINV